MTSAGRLGPIGPADSPGAGDEGPRLAFVLATTTGGTGRHVAMLAGGCLAAGHQVSVCGPAETRPLFAAGVSFEPLQIGDRPRPASDAGVIRRLAGLLRSAAPEVVHAHGIRAGAITALALASIRDWRPALVVTVHNAPPAGAAKAAAYAALERLAARRADAVLCVSADLEARMRRLGAREVSRAVIAAPAGAEDERDPDTVRAELGVAGRPLILAAGRLTGQKGFDLLLAAAARWQPGGEVVDGETGPANVPAVVIAGAGPDRTALVQLARQLGVEARLLGARTDLPSLLAAADVFVLPSRWEGQPLVLQEALRAGRPVVAFDVGGVSSVAGGAALLVPAGDVTALADAVRRVLTEPELAAGLSAAAVARSHELPDETEAVSAARAVYARLAGSRGSASRSGLPG